MIRSRKNILWYKFLIYNLVKSELRSRYKQAVLGVVWALVQPLMLVFVFTIIFSKFVKVPSDGIPYPLFSYSGLLPWLFFSSVLSRGTNSVVAYAHLIRKIYFPREVLVFAYSIVPLFDFGISILTFGMLMLYYKATIFVSIFLVLPIFLIEIIFVIGLVLALSAINVFVRDIMHAIPLVLQLWMYATPVIYPLSVVSNKLRTIYMINPMAAVVTSFREAVLKGKISDWPSLFLAATISIVTFVIGYLLFKKLEMKFVDRI